MCSAAVFPPQLVAVEQTPTFTLRTVCYDDASYGVELTITGLASEQQAKAAVVHMERLFCGQEMIEQ